jgi:hypothetical protein
MALTDEQRSMLQLLLGGQSYDDIASLLGISRDEVRARARAGLTEIGGADPDTQVAVSDYLLGQADPIGRADAVRHLQGDQDANALASRLVTQLRLLVPTAELPEIPAPRGGRRAGSGADTTAAAPSTVPGAGTPSAPAASHPGAGIPPAPPTSPGGGRRRGPAGVLDGLSGERRTQLLVGVGALGLLLVIGVLAIAGVFGGGDDGGDGGEAATTTPTDEELTIVQLGPMEAGSEATGQAVFAQTQNQPVVQMNLSELPPSREGEAYIVWLYNSDQVAFPIARDQVGENGALTGAAPVPQQITQLVGNQFGCIDVSLASTEATQKALQQAVQGSNLPRHTGESVLRGQIPTAPGQEAASGPESQCAPGGATGSAEGGQAP